MSKKLATRVAHLRLWLRFYESLGTISGNMTRCLESLSGNAAPEMIAVAEVEFLKPECARKEIAEKSCESWTLKKTESNKALAS